MGPQSWLTVAQFVYRESWDAEKINDDPTCLPLLDLDAKVAAVLTACRQTNTITKDGLVLGPVAPFVKLDPGPGTPGLLECLAWRRVSSERCAARGPSPDQVGPR